MQKVLIIGSEFFDYHKSVERAFKKLGKETRLIGVNYVYQSFSERLEYYRNKDKYFARKKQDLNDEVLGRVRVGEKVVLDQEWKTSAKSRELALDLPDGDELTIEVDFGERLRFPCGIVLGDPQVLVTKP